MIRILIVDDRNLIRLGIKSLLDRDSDFEIVGMVEDGRSAVRQVELLRPDIVLLDVEMPSMNGITATKYINRLAPNTKVIIISSHEDKKYVVKALMAGAKAYILKDSLTSDLKQTILAVNSGYSQIESKLLTKIFDRDAKTHSHTSAIFSQTSVPQYQTQVHSSSEQPSWLPESSANSATFKNPTSKQDAVSGDSIGTNISQPDRQPVNRSPQYNKSYDGNRIFLAPSPQSLNSKQANTLKTNKNSAALVVKARKYLRQIIELIKIQPYGARIFQFLLPVDETWQTKNWVSKIGYILLGVIIAVILYSL